VWFHRLANGYPVLHPETERWSAIVEPSGELADILTTTTPDEHASIGELAAEPFREVKRWAVLPEGN
jgi:hypothetical protein